MFVITMENSGVLLDSRKVQHQSQIKAAMLEMLINGPAELFVGDCFRVYDADDAPSFDTI